MHHIVEITKEHDGFDESVVDFCNQIAIKAISFAAASSPFTKGLECPFEISVLLTDDVKIREINRDYRDKDASTNVLSFAALEEDEEVNIKNQIESFESLCLGDIIISLDTVQKEALDMNFKFEERFAHMILHGILHLLGYNHEEETEADLMESIEAKILAELGFKNPYNETIGLT